MADNTVERLTAQLRRMAADFTIKPEERIVEGAMAEALSASRTPLREALNRLTSEGYLSFQPGRGFFCRALTPERILDLYEARTAIECEAARLAATRAGDGPLTAFCAQLAADAPLYDRTEDRLRLLEMDEAFHLGLVALSGNAELASMLENINGRIRYVRLMGLTLGAAPGGRMPAHRGIAEALSDRDGEATAGLLRAHIAMRKEDATQAVRAAFSQIYVEAG